MKRRNRILIPILTVLALVVGLDLLARQLQKPNRVDLDDSYSFLLQTQWHQVGDYARFVTLDDDAGCWATAIAQIAHHHRLIPAGKIEYRTSGGRPVSVNLDAYDFDHDQFPSHLDNKTPASAREQLAKYIYFIAAVLYTDFGAHGYLDHETFVLRMENHLRTSVDFHEYDREGFLRDSAAIRSLVIRELDERRPLMLYFDNGEDFGHAAVIDGYAEADGRFLVHLNMGWGGRHDGWYDLFRRIIGVRDDLQNRVLIAVDPKPSRAPP